MRTAAPARRPARRPPGPAGRRRPSARRAASSAPSATSGPRSRADRSPAPPSTAAAGWLNCSPAPSARRRSSRPGGPRVSGPPQVQLSPPISCTRPALTTASFLNTGLSFHAPNALSSSLVSVLLRERQQPVGVADLAQALEADLGEGVVLVLALEAVLRGRACGRPRPSPSRRRTGASRACRRPTSGVMTTLSPAWPASSMRLACAAIVVSSGRQQRRRPRPPCRAGCPACASRPASPPTRSSATPCSARRHPGRRSARSPRACRGPWRARRSPAR